MSGPAEEGAAAIRMADAIRIAAGETDCRREPVAEEVAVALVYNFFPFAVMMATPADLEDFAVGFSLTEGIVGAAGEILGVTGVEEEDGIEIRIAVPRERSLALRERRRRALVAGSSCGLCGVGGFAEALVPLDPVASSQSFAPEAIVRAMAELPAHQVLNRQVGAVHAAAIAGADGAILTAREDIGRHNALDKAIGAAARAGLALGQGFAAVSSRCSYEMAHKAAAAGIPLIASVSAPTAKAIDLARATGLGVAAFAREGRFTLYATPDRVHGIGMDRAEATAMSRLARVDP